MRLFDRAPDGGPKSPVEAFFLVELKGLLSIALLKFNTGGREAFHTHAFNALTWFLWGAMVEEKFDGTTTRYRRSLLPKLTRRDNNHRVYAERTSWAFTIRGPWAATWTEHSHETQTETTLSSGRVIVSQRPF